MAPHITTASSYLFVPANRPERYAKALESGADAVIVDLEDAVALPQKEEARATLARWLRGNGPQPRLWVRINAADTVWHGDDLLTFSALSMAGIVLPKAEEAKTLSSIARRLGPGRGLIALIESAAGLAAMREIAAVPGVQRLAFGSIDAQVDLGMQCGPEEEELMHFRMEMVMASRLAGIAPPIDGEWEVCWGSEDAVYGGGGTPAIWPDGEWNIPGECAIVLRGVPRRTPAEGAVRRRTA